MQSTATTTSTLPSSFAEQTTALVADPVAATMPPKRPCEVVKEALANYKAKVQDAKLRIKNAKHSVHEAQKQLRLAKRVRVFSLFFPHP
jgi:hypothetical protein